MHSVAFSPDNSLVVAASRDDSGIQIRDWATGGADATLRGHTAGVWAIAFSRDGHQLATSSADTTVELWQLRN